MAEIWRKEGAAHYGRPKVIYFGVFYCDVCGADRNCLGFDHSDEEYGTMMICEDCAHLGFTEHKLPAPVPEGGDG